MLQSRFSLQSKSVLCRVVVLLGLTFGAAYHAEGQTAPAGILKSKGEAWIVAYPAKGLPVEKAAAEELAGFVGRSAGVVASAVAENDLKAPDAADAYVGAAAYTKSAGLYREKLDPESYVVKTANGKLFIYGDDAPGNPYSSAVKTGTLSGVCSFLEDDLGITWIWPGKTGEVVPPRDGLLLPAIDRYSKPDFMIRSFTWSYQKYESQAMNLEMQKWAKRMRQAWVVKGWFGHSWYYSYFKKGMEKTHPEWMALWGGQRRGPHLCTSNKDLRDYIVQWVIDEAQRTGNRIVSISPSDGYGECECANCRKLDPPGTDYTQGDSVNLSNRHWDYANYIAREVKKRKPGLGVGMFAYVSYRNPPTNLDKLEDNLYVSFTFSAGYFVKPDEKKKFYDQIEKWATKGPRIIGREYWGMHYWLDLPYLFTREIADSTPWLHQRGVVGMYGEAEKDFSTQGPNYYLISHLMWDTKADAAKIMDRFYGAFGPAAAAVRNYYDTFEESARKHQDCIEGYGYHSLIQSWPEVFPPEEIARAGEFLAQARKAVAGDAELEARLKVVEVGYEYTQKMVELLGIYRTLGRAGVPLWFFGYEGDVAQFDHYKLPGGMPPEFKEYWTKHPTVAIGAQEKLRLLRRAKFLGEERARILAEYQDLPALSRGMYQSTLETGDRPWHKTIVEELARMENSK